MKTITLFFGLLLSILWPINALATDFNQVVSSGTTENLFGLYMITASDGIAVGNNGEMVITHDGGNNWSHMATGFFTGLRAITFVNTNTGYAVGLGGLVLKTTNTGANWTSSTPTTNDLNAVCFMDANTGYVVGQWNTALKTTNGGANWTTLNTGLVDDHLSSVVCILNKVIIGVSFSNTTNLIISNDGGNTWLSSKTRAIGDIRTLGMTASGNTICVVGYEMLTGGIRKPIFFKSIDNGISWFEPTLSGRADLRAVVITPNYPNIITVAGRYFNDPTNLNKGYIARSTDGGNTWITQPAYGTGTVTLSSAASTEDNCFIVGDNGSILKGTNPIGITPISTEVPKHFSLSQNYPNPFNPVTNINFAVKEAGTVKMYIFNSIGQEVTVLVNQHFAAGVYNVDFNASSLTSGIYFYRMEAKNFTETKKMVLVK